jgi:hypothetical protein
MTYMNLDAKYGAPRGLWRRARDKTIQPPGFMPTRVFLRLFLSALAAILAIHFWKHGGR